MAGTDLDKHTPVLNFGLDEKHIPPVPQQVLTEMHQESCFSNFSQIYHLFFSLCQIPIFMSLFQFIKLEVILISMVNMLPLSAVCSN